MLRPALILAALAITPAAADEFTSAYTDINLDDCTIMETSDFGTTWACAGYKGYPVQIAEGDVRFFVSYGIGADRERAAEQTPPPFNYLGQKIEWRLSDRTGGWRAFATIVRYFVDNDTDTDGEVLVVTRLEPGATCHVAYIDAKANPDANELARQAADERAVGFDCAKDPDIIGDFAAW